MSEGKFDPAPHLIRLPGRGGKGPTDYLPVAARIAWFRADHPDGVIDLIAHQIDERIAIFKATVNNAERGYAAGWGSETPQDFKDYIEKASTKALGRALAAMGYGTLQAGDELDEGARIVDAPQTRQDGTRATNTPRAEATPGREPAPRSAPQRPTPTPSAPAETKPAGAPPSPGDGGATWKGEVDAMAAFRSYAIEHGVDGGPRFKEVVGRPMSDFPTWEERLAALRAKVEARAVTR